MSALRQAPDMSSPLRISTYISASFMRDRALEAMDEVSALPANVWLDPSLVYVDRATLRFVYGTVETKAKPRSELHDNLRRQAGRARILHAVIGYAAVWAGIPQEAGKHVLDPEALLASVAASGNYRQALVDANEVKLAKGEWMNKAEVQAFVEQWILKFPIRSLSKQS